ncbi:hypothetical protein Bhyg_07795, partial [Pseudolycoriella hygida]
MKPRIRKKLSGVDSFVVEGIEAFEVLRTTLKVFDSDPDLKKLVNSVDSSEKYLKARYSTHCNNDDRCITH